MEVVCCSSADYDCTVAVARTVAVDCTETVDNLADKAAEMVSVEERDSFAAVGLERSSHSVSVPCVAVAVMKKDMVAGRPEGTVALGMADTEDPSSLVAGLQPNGLMGKEENAIQGYDV